jgi:hypothetical protein
MTSEEDIASHIKNYIQTHQTVQTLTKDMKQLKHLRSELEAGICEILKGKGVTRIDAPGYRIYVSEKPSAFYHHCNVSVDSWQAVAGCNKSILSKL